MGCSSEEVSVMGMERRTRIIQFQMCIRDSLTAEEFEVMKTHSMVGANMLLELPIEQQEAPLVKVASEICRWHHERYDGSGYPDGLKGCLLYTSRCV